MMLEVLRAVDLAPLRRGFPARGRGNLFAPPSALEDAA